MSLFLLHLSLSLSPICPSQTYGNLVLGDKANPQTTFHINEGHVTDMCEIGGDPVPARCPLRSQGA